MIVLAFILVFIVAFYLGWQIRQYIAIRNIQIMLDKIQREEEEAEEKEDDNYLRLSIEKHGEHYYAYSLDDDKFLSQGKTREELETNLQERFPGKKFSAHEDNLKEMFNDSL